MMSFEERCLAITADITSVPAHFFHGTMFLQTTDSEIATRVYSALVVNNQSCGVIFGKCGEETSYDFV